MVGSLKLDTWTRWSAVSVYTFLNHAISGTAGNVVDPWIMNEVQDDSHSRLRFSKRKAFFMIIFYKIAGWIDYVLYLVIALSRLDLMIIGMAADVSFQGRVFWQQVNRKSHSLQADGLVDSLV